MRRLTAGRSCAAESRSWPCWPPRATPPIERSPAGPAGTPSGRTAASAGVGWRVRTAYACPVRGSTSDSRGTGRTAQPLSPERRVRHQLQGADRRGAARAASPGSNAGSNRGGRRRTPERSRRPVRAWIPTRRTPADANAGTVKPSPSAVAVQFCPGPPAASEHQARSLRLLASGARRTGRRRPYNAAGPSPVTGGGPFKSDAAAAKDPAMHDAALLDSRDTLGCPCEPAAHRGAADPGESRPCTR